MTVEDVPRRSGAQSRLTPMQLKFVSEYLAGKGRIEAARRAGYKNPERQCSKLMRRSVVVDAIERGQLDLRAATTIELDKVLQELGSIAFSDVRGIFDPETGALLPPAQWPDHAAAAIAGFDVVTQKKGEGEVEYVAKVKTWSKTDALDKLMRYLGAYQDKLQVTHDVSRLEQKLQEGRQRVARMKVVGGTDTEAG